MNAIHFTKRLESADETCFFPGVGAGEGTSTCPPNFIHRPQIQTTAQADLRKAWQAIRAHLAPVHACCSKIFFDLSVHTSCTRRLLTN
jgi:hypothetical protein